MKKLSLLNIISKYFNKVFILVDGEEKIQNVALTLSETRNDIYGRKQHL